MTLNKILSKLRTWRDLLFAPMPKGITLTKEQLIQREVYLMLCDLVHRGALKGVMFHAANEVGGYQQNSLKAMLRTMVFKAIGMLAGVPDIIVLWSLEGGGNGCGGIELKAKGGSLSDNQKLVRSWFEEMHIPWALCRSKEEVYDTLLAWGALRVTQVAP